VIGTLVRTLLVGAVLIAAGLAAGWVLAGRDAELERKGGEPHG
jgi:hypothetical protein